MTRTSSERDGVVYPTYRGSAICSSGVSFLSLLTNSVNIGCTSSYV